MFKMEGFVKRMVFIVYMCVFLTRFFVFVCIPEESLELGKQRTLRKSSSIWLTLPPPIRVALWVGIKKLCRYVEVDNF